VLHCHQRPNCLVLHEQEASTLSEEQTGGAFGSPGQSHLTQPEEQDSAVAGEAQSRTTARSQDRNKATSPSFLIVFSSSSRRGVRTGETFTESAWSKLRA
jgi:hypothetical protein